MKISVIIFALVLISAFAAAPAATDRAGNIRRANFQASSNVSSSSVSFSNPAAKKTPAPTLMRKPKMPTFKPQVKKPVAAAPVKNVAAPVKTATAPVKPTCNITFEGFPCYLGYPWSDPLSCLRMRRRDRRDRELQMTPPAFFAPAYYNCTDFLIEFEYFVANSNSDPSTVKYVTSLIGEKGTNLVGSSLVYPLLNHGMFGGGVSTFRERQYFNVCQGLRRSFQATVLVTTNSQSTVPSSKPTPSSAGTTCTATTTITFSVPKLVF